tara:strand:+ start:162 stop:722 length:561 start_codon:yes stop_codon:yes gene_type:complete
LSNGGLIGAFSSASGKADTVMDTNGQILYYNNGRKALDKEDNDDVLTLKSGLPSWEPASGGATVTIQKVSCTNGSNTTSSSFVDIPNSSITLPTRSGGFSFLSANVMFNNSSSDTNIKLAIYHNGSAQIVQTLRIYDNSNEHFCSATAMQALDGSVCKLQYAVSSGTATIINISTNTSTLQSFEVS